VNRAPTWWLAWGTWLLTLALYGFAFTVIAVVGHSAATDQDTWAARASLLVAFGTVGALVASRQPRNAIGWMFLAVALLVALSVSGGEYANFAFVEHPGLPGGYLAGWLYLWTWFPVLGLMVAVPLLFPDRPLGIGALDRLYDHLEAISSFVLVLFLAGSAAASVGRFRRSRGDERQQLKWMTWGVAVWVVWVPVSMAVGDGDVSSVLFALTIAVLPAATAIALFKYRLYEADRVISRTLVYGSLTVILVGAYAALVLAGQAVFSSFTGGSNFAIAVSTLAVAAVALPLRARVQRFVDRRFYRRRYDAQRTLEAFGARLREEIDLRVLGDDLRGVVTETMQPAHLSLWLRSGS
jgi:hypothetical protein